MNIKEHQLPVQQFERLGISQERLNKLPKDEMKNILSGFPSNMKFLTFKDHEGNMQKVNAKLSVYQNTDGTIGLKVHPYRARIKNDMELSKNELNQLKSGSTVQKKHHGRDYLVQLDQSINELRKIRVDHIKVAEAAGKAQLTPRQKEDLLAGKAIQVKDSIGRTTTIKLDLSRPSGIRISSPKEKLDRSNATVENQITKEHKQQAHIGLKR